VTRQQASDAAAAWLVTGEDPSLVAQAVSGLVSELVGPADRALVLEDFAGDQVDVGAVVNACRTPPFFADRRVVVVRDAGHFGADQLQVLLGYLQSPLATTKLVVAGGGGQLPAKFVAAWREAPAGRLVSTDVSPKEAHSWLTEQLASASVKLDREAAAVLEAHLGEDLGRLHALLGVLEAAYGAGALIGREELEPYLGQQGSVPPWDLTDAIDRGDTEEALGLLHRLAGAGGRHPLVILAILHRHFSNVLQVQSPSIATEADAAAALGIPKGRSTFPAKKALDSARRLGAKGAGDAILALADAELALKGKLEWEPIWVLEVLVARLCRLSRFRRAPARAGRVPAGPSGSGRPSKAPAGTSGASGPSRASGGASKAR
jgi:DNA polymerase-3 subunit delta